MPTYEFIDTKTGDVFEKSMKMAEYDQFMEQNPHIQRHFSEPSMLGDPIRLGVKKIDSGFKEVLQKIHSRAPGSQLDKTNNL